MADLELAQNPAIPYDPDPEMVPGTPPAPQDAAAPAAAPGAPGAPGAGGGGLSQDGLEALQNAGLGLMREKQTALASKEKEINAAGTDLTSTKQPDLQQPPTAPKQEIGKNMQEFVQVAALLGAIAGTFARRGTTTGLNAFSGAIQGLAQGNMEIFKAKRQEFEDTMAQVSATNKQKLEAYDRIWKNKKMSLDQKMNEYALVAARYQDEINYNLAMQKNYTALANANMKERQAQFNMDATRERLTMQAQRLQDQHDQGMATVQPIIDGIKSGDLPPVTTGLYGRAAAVKAGLAKEHFNLTQAFLEYQAAQKQVQSLNGPQMTRYAGLAVGVVNTIDRVKELADQLHNSGVPTFNQAKLTALIQTRGNTPQGQLAVRYVGAVNTLKEEFANLANGGYAPTEPAWKLANQQINGNYGDRELGASLDEVQRLIKYRLNAIPNFNTLGPNAPNRYKPQAAPGGGNGGWSVVQ